MEQIDLKAQVRKKTGKGPARTLRREGKMPAVLYGQKTDSIMLSIDIREFEQIVKNANVGSLLLNLQIQNGKTLTRPAMIKELQVHPVSGKILHIDFYEIDMERKIRVGVPVVAVVPHLFGTTVYRETNPLAATYVWAGEWPLPVVYRDAWFEVISPSTADDLVARGLRHAQVGLAGL